MTAATTPILRVENLTKCYGTTCILKGASLTLGKGEIKVLIGPSGGGKSTLLQCLNCLVQPDSGEIWLDGVQIDLHSKPDLYRLRQQVGMIFQDFNLFDHLSALDNITIALRKVKKAGRREAEERARIELDQVGLGDKGHLYPAQLSGGQKQRVAIARALAMDPKVLLLDEPTSALDPLSTAKIEELIDELKHDYTIAIVTHNMQQAARCSDYTAYMYLGEMIEFGATEQIFFKPERKETEDYITGRFG